MTPGAVHMAGMTQFPSNCPWCRTAIGYHDHVFWECGKRPLKIAKPKCKLQRRLGWASAAKKNADKDRAVLDWMQVVVEEVWSQRYGDEWCHKKRQTEGKEVETDSDTESESDGQV